MVKSLAVCSWSLRPDGVNHLCRQLLACGLDQIQIALDPIAEGRWDLAQTATALSEEEVSICSGMMTTVGEDYSTLESIRETGGLRPDRHWEANLARARVTAGVARELGIGLVTLHAGFVPEDDAALHETMADRIGTVASVFAEQGVDLGLETGQEHAETLLGLLSTIYQHSGVRVGVNFDPANMILYGMGDPAQAMERLGEHIVQVHIKDAIAAPVAGAWGTEVPAGEGEVDWDRFFAAVENLPRPIDCVIEREAGKQRVTDIITARELAHRHGCAHKERH